MHAYKAHQGQTGRKNFTRRCIAYDILCPKRGGGNSVVAGYSALFKNTQLKYFLREDSQRCDDGMKSAAEGDGRRRSTWNRTSGVLEFKLFREDVLFRITFLLLLRRPWVFAHNLAASWLARSVCKLRCQGFVSDLRFYRKKLPKTHWNRELTSMFKAGVEDIEKAPKQAKNENRSRRETIDPKHNCAENEDQTRSALCRIRRLEPSKKASEWEEQNSKVGQTNFVFVFVQLFFSSASRIVDPNIISWPNRNNFNFKYQLFIFH